MKKALLLTILVITSLLTFGCAHPIKSYDLTLPLERMEDVRILSKNYELTKFDQEKIKTVLENSGLRITKVIFTVDGNMWRASPWSVYAMIVSPDGGITKRKGNWWHFRPSESLEYVLLKLIEDKKRENKVRKAKKELGPLPLMHKGNVVRLYEWEEDPYLLMVKVGEIYKIGIFYREVMIFDIIKRQRVISRHTSLKEALERIPAKKCLLPVSPAD